jgi:hypothetical protein
VNILLVEDEPHVRQALERAMAAWGHDVLAVDTGASALAALPGYLRRRPSAAGGGHDGSISSGSTYGPTSENLRTQEDKVRALVEDASEGTSFSPSMSSTWKALMTSLRASPASG